MRSRILLALLVPLSLVMLAVWAAPFGAPLAAAAPPGWSLALLEPDWGLVLRQSVPAAAPAALALALAIPLVRLAWRRWALAPVLAVALLGTAALAQTTDPATASYDVRAWFSDPLAAIAAVAAAVAALRLRFPKLDGWSVPVLAHAIGAIGGALGQLAGLLVVIPFSTWPAPWGGLVYGLAAAFGAVTGVSLFAYFVGKAGEGVAAALARLFPPAGTAPTSPAADPALPPGGRS